MTGREIIHYISHFDLDTPKEYYYTYKTKTCGSRFYQADDNGIIDFHGDVNQQLYDLFEIDAANIAHIREVLASKPK